MSDILWQPDTQRISNDPGGDKLRASCFSQFPSVWAQGDYAEQLAHGASINNGFDSQPGLTEAGNLVKVRQPRMTACLCPAAT